jgi:ElaB protein
MDEPNDNNGGSNLSDAPRVSRTTVPGETESAGGTRASDADGRGSQSSGPSVLAQPPVEGAEGNGSELPDKDDSTASTSKPTLAAVKDVFAGVQDTIATRYRDASESTDDFVHDSPWMAIAFATLGGVIVGMLASR